MKLSWVVFVVVMACDSGKRTAGTGSASAVAAPPADAGPPTCALDGTYRLRFHSNGADGWWMFLKVVANKADVVGGKIEMLHLAVGPIATAVDLAACSLTLTAKTDNAGDVKITLAVALDGAVTGQLSRSIGGDKDQGPETTPIKGVRETSPAKRPACLNPGVFELTPDAKTTWKLSHGHPRFGLGCKMDPMNASARIRVSVLGPDIVVDEIEENGSQGFERGTVTRVGDCAITLALQIQDFEFTGAHLTLDGDKITGSFDDVTWAFMEDGDAGENLWKCNAKHAVAVGTRVAD